jgi:hypothetical protein
MKQDMHSDERGQVMVESVIGIALFTFAFLIAGHLLYMSSNKIRVIMAVRHVAWLGGHDRLGDSRDMANYRFLRLINNNNIENWFWHPVDASGNLRKTVIQTPKPEQNKLNIDPNSLVRVSQTGMDKTDASQIFADNQSGEDKGTTDEFLGGFLEGAGPYAWFVTYGMSSTDFDNTTRFPFTNLKMAPTLPFMLNDPVLPEVPTQQTGAQFFPENWLMAYGQCSWDEVGDPWREQSIWEVLFSFFKTFLGKLGEIMEVFINVVKGLVKFITAFIDLF